MALNAFTNTFTAQQIVQLAELRSGQAGYHLDQTSGVEAVTAPAYKELQAILDHLAQWFDYQFQHDAITITMSSRATTLPEDYWRAAFSTAFVTHPVTGARTPLPLIGNREWHERMTPSPLGTGMPTCATIMKNTGFALEGTANGVLYVDPAPDVSYLVELHYNPVASPLPLITTVPWFPDSQYLVTKLAAKLCAYQDDTRALALDAEAERLMGEILRSQSDPGQRSHAIRHDVLSFRPPLRLCS